MKAALGFVRWCTDLNNGLSSTKDVAVATRRRHRRAGSSDEVISVIAGGICGGNQGQ